MNDIKSFVKKLSTSKNIRVYKKGEAEKKDFRNLSPAVNRLLIKEKNSKL